MPGRSSAQHTSHQSHSSVLSRPLDTLSRIVTSRTLPPEASRRVPAARARRHRWRRNEHVCDYPARRPATVIATRYAGSGVPLPPSSVHVALPSLEAVRGVHRRLHESSASSSHSPPICSDCNASIAITPCYKARKLPAKRGADWRPAHRRPRLPANQPERGPTERHAVAGAHGDAAVHAHPVHPRPVLRALVDQQPSVGHAAQLRVVA